MILGEMVQKIGFQIDSHQLEGLHHRLEGINSNVKVIAGIEVAHALYELAERFAGLGEHLESTALSAGLTTTELQKLQFAASQNAVGNEELSGALARLNRQLYAAKQGSKQAQALFTRLGITQQQIAGFRTSAEALAAIQDQFGNIEDASERQAVTMQLFGRGGAGMVKFLVAGSKATKELGNSAERMGAVVSRQGVKNLAEFEDAASGLAQVFKSFMATVGSQLAPAFIEVIHLIEKAWADNLPFIQKNIRAFAIKAAFYIGFTAESVRLLFKLVTAFAEDHAGLLSYVAKWGPAIMVAAAAFDVFVETLGKVNRGWEGVAKYAPKGWKALVWGLEKLQLFTLYVLEGMVQFFGLFSPALAASIRAVGLAIAGLTPLQFAAVIAAVGLLVAAAHDLYEYFFKDVPFEKLWIAKLVKWLEPVTSRLSKMLKIANDALTWTGTTEADKERAKVASEVAARRGPMSTAAASLPSLFGGAHAMGQTFRPNDPINAGPVKTSVILNNAITVNVPAGMSTEDAIKVSRQGVTDPLQEFLDRAWVDTGSAAAR